MARSDPQVNLRMPADLKDRLDAAAVESKRSLTAEVVARLEMSFRPAVSKAITKETRLEQKIEAHRQEMVDLRERLRLLDETLSKADQLLSRRKPDE